MRTAKKTVPTLDLFRLAAVLLVVMNHTSPLADVSAMADFWLTRVLARVAVPFFLMTTGYFLSRNHWAGVGRQLKKLCLLYGVCILLYLPVGCRGYSLPPAAKYRPPAGRGRRYSRATSPPV